MTAVSPPSITENMWRSGRSRLTEIGRSQSIAFQQVVDETFDVGVDTRTGVNDKDYQSPFPFKGTINKLTVKLGPSQLAAEDQKAKAEAIARVND